MQEDEREKLESFTIDLSKKVTEIGDKIKIQSLMLEGIQHQAKANDESFKKSQHLFDDALISLDRDKRSSLILFLLVVIAVLVYILRT